MAAPASSVFAFLADLENHARLAPGSVDLLALEGRGPLDAAAVVQLKGPLGVRRTAATELQPRPPHTLAGRARVGDRTHVSVRWAIHPHAHGCVVSLSAVVDVAGLADGLLLRLGGRRWLARRFRSALHQLERELSPAFADLRVPDAAAAG